VLVGIGSGTVAVAVVWRVMAVLSMIGWRRFFAAVLGGGDSLRLYWAAILGLMASFIQTQFEADFAFGWRTWLLGGGLFFYNLCGHGFIQARQCFSW